MYNDFQRQNIGHKTVKISKYFLKGKGSKYNIVLYGPSSSFCWTFIFLSIYSLSEVLPWDIEIYEFSCQNKFMLILGRKSGSHI